MQEHFDVLVVGAGISGIGAGVHLQKHCPDRSYAIFEGRERLGGTWDLFQYPGIRSDSDMYTLGFSFKPWTDAKAIADGPSILSYLKDTANEYGVADKIRYQHMVKRASWSSEDARWTVDAQVGDNGETVQVTCGFLYMCSGYYNYEAGYTPDFPGIENFAGQIVHPQKWSPDIGYAGQRVVVIGSGATAVTLVPELAKEAAHVTMLQRSPTYVVSRPEEDGMANWMNARLPAKLAYAITRWKNILGGIFIYRYSKKKPEKMKSFILEQVRKQLGDDYDVATHFTPTYNPWDQRMCLVPNGDLFDAIRDGSASVVTDHIDTFTEKGIRLKSGDELEADLVVTATGLDVQFLSDLAITVDGEAIDPTQGMTYKGMMLSDIPNLAWAMGYTNASWTLKCDLTAEYLCRLLNHMKQHGYDQCVPRSDGTVDVEPWVDFSSGYIQRSLHKMPQQGTKAPWKLNQNYVLDLAALSYKSVDDGVMSFSRKSDGIAGASA